MLIVVFVVVGGYCLRQRGIDSHFRDWPIYCSPKLDDRKFCVRSKGRGNVLITFSSP